MAIEINHQTHGVVFPFRLPFHIARGSLYLPWGWDRNVTSSYPERSDFSICGWEVNQNVGIQSIADHRRNGCDVFVAGFIAP